MKEHPSAGGTVTLLMDGEEVEYPLEEGISWGEGQEQIHSMLGVDVGDSPTEVNHPDLEFTDLPIWEHPEPDGLRTVCRLDGCEHTEVFEHMKEILESDWEDVEMPVSLLTDMTELHYAYCPDHARSDDEGHDPEESGWEQYKHIVANDIEIDPHQ